MIVLWLWVIEVLDIYIVSIFVYFFYRNIKYFVIRKVVLNVFIKFRKLNCVEIDF